MEINTLVELLEMVGFPIMMVGYFIWDKSKCMLQMTEAIKNNTLMMEKILIKLDMCEEGGKDA